MSESINIDELISSGIHFGHRVRSWNPKMKNYIFRKRNGIHILDIKETIKGLIRAQRFVEMVVASGKDVLFVGTKRQASAIIEMEAKDIGMSFVAERWLGGTLTNHGTILKRLHRLEELEKLLADDTESGFSKKMLASLSREYRKIHRNLNGIRRMNGMPGAIILIDINREHNAIAEARRMKIPTVALVDTDSDPELVDVVVPGNDDALKSIALFLKVMKEGVRRGLERRRTEAPANKAPAGKTSEAQDAAAEQGIKASKPAAANEAPAEAGNNN